MELNLSELQTLWIDKFASNVNWIGMTDKTRLKFRRYSMFKDLRYKQ